MSLVRDVEAALERLFGALDPPFVCWLDSDAGPSYCRECAEKAVAAGKGESVDGGWGCQESDGCEHCETCGRVLDYWLTDYGVKSELDHFEDNTLTAPIDPETAFHLIRLMGSAPDDAGVKRLAERIAPLLGVAA